MLIFFLKTTIFGLLIFENIKSGQFFFQLRKFKRPIFPFVKNFFHTLWFCSEWTFKAMIKVTAINEQPSWESHPREKATELPGYYRSRTLGLIVTWATDVKSVGLILLPNPPEPQDSLTCPLLHRNHWDAPLYLLRAALIISLDQILLIKMISYVLYPYTLGDILILINKQNQVKLLMNIWCNSL